MYGFNPRGGEGGGFGWNTDNADRKRPGADKQSVVYYSTKPLKKEREGSFRRGEIGGTGELKISNNNNNINRSSRQREKEAPGRRGEERREEPQANNKIKNKW